MSGSGGVAAFGLSSQSGESREGRAVVWYEPFKVACRYVHPSFRELRTSFDHACSLFNNDEKDARGEKRRVIPWEGAFNLTGLQGQPRPRTMTLFNHGVGATWEERVADVTRRRWRPAIHTEAFDFALQSETRDMQRELRIVAPGSFNPRPGSRRMNRCVTYLRTDDRACRWLDFLFLDEEPSEDLWMLCVEA